jgi:hypothetical protein
MAFGLRYIRLHEGRSIGGGETCPGRLGAATVSNNGTGVIIEDGGRRRMDEMMESLNTNGASQAHADSVWELLRHGNSGDLIGWKGEDQGRFAI